MTDSMNQDALLKASGLYKSYDQGASKLEILKGVDVEIKKGEDVCIVGVSGAGKSTLLHLLGALDQPTSGEVYFNGEALYQKSDEDLAKFRNQSMGFVFQFHHLLNEFTALENVMMPGRIAGWSVNKCKEKATGLLEELSLSHRIHHFPSEMSGGEQQRVAVARALFNDPEILFADEPTGNLDGTHSGSIQELFFELKESRGMTLVTVTHDPQFASQFSRVLKLVNGVWA